ncbi:MAG: hypothetical protein WCA05_15460, partial [Pseudolabrys sp.]
MKKTYTGGCQCGKVRYEAQADIGDVITCNCSRCRKLGPLLSAVVKSDFKVLAGENELTDYQVAVDKAGLNGIDVLLEIPVFTVFFVQSCSVQSRLIQP